MTRAWRWFCETVVFFEGSTRPIALMRIGLALLLWTRWSDDLLAFRTLCLSDPLVRLISLSFFLSTTLMCLGLWSRFSSAWAGVSAAAVYYYIGFGLGAWQHVHHHTYLLAIAALLLSLTPCGGSYSIDRWLALRRAEKREREPLPERGALWATRLIALQLSLVYFWGACSKMNTAFLSGDRLESMVLYYYFGSDAPGFPGFRALMAALSIATVLLEYGLAIGLWFSPLRRRLMPIGILFHLLIFYLFPVETFSLTMILLYLAYLDPDAVHRLIDSLQEPLPARKS